MKQQIIEKYLKPDKTDKTNTYYSCPNCNWKNPRLGIDYSRDVFFCWYCHFGGHSLTTILYKVNASRADIIEMKNILGEEFKNKKKPTGTLLDLKEAIQDKFDTKNQNSKELNPFFKIPEEYKPLKDHWKSVLYRPAINYLKNERGLSKYEIDYYNIHYSINDDKLLIPSYDKSGRLNFYIKRTASTQNKYYEIPPNSKASRISFFEYLTDFTRPIVITEGAFDAMKSGFNTVPLLGTFMNKALISNITAYGTPRVTIALDSDAFISAIQHAIILKKHTRQIFILPPHDKKDLGELDKKEIVELFKPKNLIQFDDNFLLQYKLTQNLL
jgi:hypothetical protein